MPSEAPRHLLWVDVETTGLDVERDKLLEIAMILTDADLNELETRSWVIAQKVILNELHPVVRQMHLDNGLLLEVIDSNCSYHNLCATLRTWLDETFTAHGVKKGSLPLAGSSVHFDRQWLDRAMSNVTGTDYKTRQTFLDRYVSHRNVDVSSLRTLMKMWYPDRVWDTMEEPQHRAMDDLLDHIAELKHYRAMMR